VRFAGRQSSEEVPWWLNAADMVVLPSRSEGRPNAVLEAQACGLPVVATRVGGTPELIEDGRTGLLVEPENVEALARAIARLRDDAGLRLRLGQEGRAAVTRGDSSWAASARRTRQVYEELLENRGGHVRDRG
jgi:glycosyltransferase involved in cell wall biosynthesis